MVFGLIWMVRRHEAEYGWLSIFLLLGTFTGSVLIPDFGLGGGPYSIWTMFGFWEAAAGLMFMRAVAGLSTKRVHLWFAVPPAVLWILFLANPSVFMPNLVIQVGAAVILGYALLGQWFLWRAARRGNLEALFILIGMAFWTMFAVHDVLSALAVGGKTVFLARSAMSGLLLTICALMTLRFLRAMTQLDDTAQTLRGQVAYAEKMLKESYEELQARRDAQAVSAERVRLMRDLHDGVGGDLASMLALAGETPARGPEIAKHARAALVDMRLIIGSLEDYGGNLTLALAAWRERAEPQLRAAGITLRWDVDRLPRLPWLGPSHVLDILRIVQESVTNVIKHAHAMCLEVTARECGEGVEILLEDDGIGIGTGTDRTGNGLRNMDVRAGRLGGRLSVELAAQGTVVRLIIPTTSPTTNPPSSVP
jgi:signal transduction histidine kinase